MFKFFIIRNEATFGYFTGTGFGGLVNAARYDTEEEAVYDIEHKAELAHCYLTIVPVYHI
ncbi:MAG: hypothetical protein LBU62_05395 [Bacteroidales bacterium]|jgi:hypothetical protein|nr:hypothetical protein [Bacteroidales bacterium]